MTDKEKLKSYYKYQLPLRFIKNKFFGSELKNLYKDDFLTVNSLFPAIYFDSGYGVLMKNFPEENAGIVRQYGSIQVITD